MLFSCTQVPLVAVRQIQHRQKEAGRERKVGRNEIGFGRNENEIGISRNENEKEIGFFRISIDD